MNIEELGKLKSLYADGLADINSELSDVAIVANDIQGENNIGKISTALDDGTFNDVDLVVAEPLKTNINTVGDNNGKVTIVADNIADINTISTDIANVNTVGTNISDVNSVADNIININSVSSNETNINSLAGNEANINIVADNVDAIDALVNENTGLAELISNQANVDIVANDISSVQTVSTNIANVNTTADNISSVNTVSSIKNNVNSVASNEANITTVASNNSNVTAVGQNINNVNTVASNNSNINSVVTNVVPNMAQVLSAETNATTATTQASIATTKASEASTSSASATTQANRAESEADRAEGYADSINPEELVSISQVASSTNTNPDSTSIVNDNLVFTNSYFNYTAGITDKGYTLTSRDVTKTVDSSGVSDGIKWVSENSDGTNSFFNTKPSYGLYTKTSADDNRPVIDVDTGKVYSTTGGELIVNGTFDTNLTGWTDTSTGSGTASVENGTLKVTGVSSVSNLGSIEQSFLTQTGEVYKLSIDFLSFSNTNLYIDGIKVIDQINESIDYEFVAVNSSTTIKLEIYSFATAYYDNISVYKKEATIGAEILPTPSFMQNPVYFDNGIPQYIDYSQSLEVNYMDSLNVKDLVVQDKFDLGQTWQDVTSERSAGVTYTNTTGKPIEIIVYSTISTASKTFSLTIDGLTVDRDANSGSDNVTVGVSSVVQNGSEYTIDANHAIAVWSELR